MQFCFYEKLNIFKGRKKSNSTSENKTIIRNKDERNTHISIYTDDPQFPPTRGGDRIVQKALESKFSE